MNSISLPCQENSPASGTDVELEDFGGGLDQEGETGNQVEIESPARRKKPRKSVSFVTDSPVSGGEIKHPLLKTTLTGLRRTYLRFLVFRPKLTKTKPFPPFLDHMNGKLFLGGSRFWSGKIGPKLAVGGHRSQCPAELSFIFNRCPAGNPLFLTDKIYF